MKKLLISIVAALSLSGCMWQTVNRIEVEQAITFCNGIENLYTIESYAVGNVFVYCKNGTRTTIRNGAISK